MHPHIPRRTEELSFEPESALSSKKGGGGVGGGLKAADALPLREAQTQPTRQAPPRTAISTRGSRQQDDAPKIMMITSALAPTTSSTGPQFRLIDQKVQRTCLWESQWDSRAAELRNWQEVS
jgi:hypothetical protein